MSMVSRRHGNAAGKGCLLAALVVVFLQAAASGADPTPSMPPCDPSAPSCCGNHICEGDDEDFGSCPIDCQTCGNGVCDAGETESNCAQDCGCTPVGCGSRCGPVDDGCGHPLDCGPCEAACNNNGVCDAGENHLNCPDDCPAVVCGTCEGRCGLVDDGCGNILDCGSCEPPPGIDDAEIVAPRLPFSLRCSETYDATITVKNTGTTTWTSAAGYKLGAVGNTDPFASPRVELPAGVSVPPGASYTFALTLTAPSEGGSWLSDWQMVREYVRWFGGVASETIRVSCSCGNGVCDEPAATCPQDCMTSICNNNGVCDPGEDTTHCPLDNCVCVPTLNCVGKCGVHDDGCGHPSDCGACDCTPNVPTFTVSQAHASVGAPITFTANTSLILDPPAPLWDMGNAVHLSGNPLTYRYPAPGSYNVVLTAAESACRRVMLSSVTPVVIDPACVPEANNPAKCCGNGVCDVGDPYACPEECPADAPSCETVCPQAAATCNTPCAMTVVPPVGPPQTVPAVCSAYAVNYPDQPNNCATCVPRACDAAPLQAEIYCRQRGGVGAITCDPRATEATIGCSDGSSCALVCDPSTHELQSQCGFLCGDNRCTAGIESCGNCETDCGACSDDPEGLDVVTYNIQMLTGLAAAGCHSPCLNDIRGPLIAAAPELHNRDVLVFVEAFDDVERNRLINRLKSEYPFYTTVLDGPGPLPFGVHYLNGGVFIMSKWPIVKEDQHIYDICHDIINHTFDCWASKGVKYARIRRTNRMWHVYATHTDASDDPADAGTRAYQMKEMQFFISTTLPIQATHGDILLMAGDFNIDRNKPGQQEYYNMLSTLQAVDPSPGEPGGTNRDGNWIDYVLYGAWANLNRPSTAANRVMHVFDYSGQHYEYFAYPQLSDHHAVLGNFTVFRQDDLSGQAMSTQQSLSAASEASEASPLGSEPSAPTPEECTASVELSAATALAPLGAIDRDVQTFRWSEVAGADAYRLEVIDTVTGTSVVDVVVRETVFTAKPPFAMSGRPYRWRVTPQRASAAGPPSADQVFTYEDTPIPAPVATGPLGTVDGDYPTFSWSAVSSADAYHLVVVDVESEGVVVDGLAPASSITAEKPCVPGRQYRWKVSARRGSKDGPASQELSFTCTSATGLAAPTAREPVGDIDTARPTFSWDGVEGGRLYQLDVFDVETSTLFLRARVAATAFTPPVSLTPGRAYRWMVKALKDDVVVETVPPPDAIGGPFSAILVFRPLPPNRAPSVAISGCHECVVPCRVTLNALASDPDGDVLSYSWSGCASGTASTATCTLETAGPTSATVTVTDGRGGTATASTTVDGRPWVVTVNATPTCASTGCTVTFEAASAENPPGGAVAFSWSGCGSAAGPVLTCQRPGSGSLAATVTATSAGGATATAQAQVQVLPAQFSTGAWSACTGTGAWTCNAAGANGCQRSGSQTRSVTESAWTTNPAEAATVPPGTQPCTETAPGYVATYSATYAANWTCTAGGANGCYKNRVSYSASTFRAAPPDAPVPAATLYTYGYVASWNTGQWSGCSATACNTSGWYTRSVWPASWTPDAPDAPRPPDALGCSVTCSYTCYDYGLYETWRECYDAGWEFCDTRYRDDGQGGLLTCRHGYN